jgi:AAA ATPase domain
LIQKIFIDGIGISSYRSFGPEIQRIGPFEKINLFIGQNNSGKSNILRFLKDHYIEALKAIQGNFVFPNFKDLDKHIGTNNGKTSLAFGLKIGGDKYKALLDLCRVKIEQNKSQSYNLSQIITDHLIGRIETVLKNLPSGKNTAWFTYLLSSPIETPLGIDARTIQELNTKNILKQEEWKEIYSSLMNASSGDLEGTCIPKTLEFFVKIIYSNIQFKIDFIPAIRQIGEQGKTENDHSGLGLIDRLAKLQNPGHDRQDLRKQFEKINEFLRTVVGNRTATLEIPYDRDVILVRMDEKTLPLSSLGTGIHELIILAAAATVLTEQVLCIEELELHLHPLLQKKLIRYLADKTDNQYFITTHSAHLLDTPGAAIFHVRHSEGVSKVESVHTTSEKSHICADLGYRASDLLQANYIVWVEGPSDRIYINHWINAAAPELVEGLHYSIMFYGGRLLSHLSGEERDLEEQEVNKFIDLRSLNRNISIVIDSDRKQEDSSINKTKQRIVKEFNTNTGFAWVTKGREIENYIEPDLLEEAVKKVHKNAVSLNQKGQFDHCLPYVTDKKR